MNISSLTTLSSFYSPSRLIHLLFSFFSYIFTFFLTLLCFYITSFIISFACLLPPSLPHILLHYPSLYFISSPSRVTPHGSFLQSSRTPEVGRVIILILFHLSQSSPLSLSHFIRCMISTYTLCLSRGYTPRPVL